MIYLNACREDSILTTAPIRVVEEFQLSGAGVLVSSDVHCWPDRTLESLYPKFERGSRFVNAGGIILKTILTK